MSIAGRRTKKEQILELHEQGADVETIATALDTSATYVANTLAAAGLSIGYADLYTSTSLAPGGMYAKAFAGALRFKTPAAAAASVKRIDQLYHRFQRQGDRRGQHQAQMIALIGKNRAQGIGKTDEAKMFAEWLKRHLDDDEEHEEGVGC